MKNKDQKPELSAIALVIDLATQLLESSDFPCLILSFFISGRLTWVHAAFCIAYLFYPSSIYICTFSLYHIYSKKNNSLTINSSHEIVPY